MIIDLSVESLVPLSSIQKEGCWRNGSHTHKAIQHHSKKKLKKTIKFVHVHVEADLKLRISA